MIHPQALSVLVLAACTCCGLAQATSVADPLPEPFPDTAEAKAYEASDALEDLYMQGQIAEVARQGLDFIRTSPQPIDAELRLKIALSLSATHQPAQAIEQLQAVVDSGEMPAARQARLPLANAHRWAGRPDLAQPHFEQALKDEPGNADAQSGLTAVNRDLRPRTSIQWIGTDDNGGLRSQQAVLAHRWRSADLTQIYEVDAHLNRHEFTTTGPSAHARGATVRYQRVDVPLEPKVSVSFDGAPLSGLLGELRLKLSDSLSVSLARDNWGDVSLAPRALAQGMTANRLSADGVLLTEWGVVSGRVAFNRVSDGNQITTTTVKYTPALHLMNGVVKPYVFVDTREVDFATPSYWSPAEGVGLYGLGTTLEWVNSDWYFILAGQYGQRWYGDAGKSWVGSASVLRWVDDKTAVSANWFGLSSVRDRARYRSKSITLKVDRLW